VPGSAEARVAVKAARFRTAFVQLRASGVLRTACDSPAFYASLSLRYKDLSYECGDRNLGIGGMR
jgi:hypothetical protein